MGYSPIAQCKIGGESKGGLVEWREMWRVRVLIGRGDSLRGLVWHVLRARR